jgi:hypothetical protein
MQVKTIEMDKKKARERYLVYLNAIKAKKGDIDARHRKEMEVLKKTYRQLSLGSKVLDINDVMCRAGCNHEGHPRLAIGRPNKKWCRFERWGDRCSFHSMDDSRGNTWRVTVRNTVRFPSSFFPGDNISGGDTIAAMIPNVPPEFQPEKNLHQYHLLWEPVWQRVAPEDPILLKHLGGPMYLVCAQWDLTDIERAVLFASNLLD